MVTYSLRGLHGRVVDSLGVQIVRGKLPPGTVIDPEHLAEELDVSRTLIREAIKVLTAKGLVDARPRTGTRVLQRDAWNLLDPDVMRWRDGGDPDDRLLRELEEVRQVLEPAAARLAARRRSPAHVEAMRDAWTTMADPSVPVDRQVAADVSFHRALLGASDNELIARLEVVFEPALRARDALVHHQRLDQRFIRLHEAVLLAVEASDEEGAVDAANALLEAAAEDTSRVLGSRRRRR